MCGLSSCERGGCPLGPRQEVFSSSPHGVSGVTGVALGGVGEGSMRSRSEISHLLNWLAGDWSASYVLGTRLTTSPSQLIFLAF